MEWPLAYPKPQSIRLRPFMVMGDQAISMPVHAWALAPDFMYQPVLQSLHAVRQVACMGQGLRQLKTIASSHNW